MKTSPNESRDHWGSSSTVHAHKVNKRGYGSVCIKLITLGSVYWQGGKPTTKIRVRPLHPDTTNPDPEKLFASGKVVVGVVEELANKGFMTNLGMGI